MTALTVPAVDAPPVRDGAVPTRGIIEALARAEAWRLVRHPIVLIGLALSVAEVVAAWLTSGGHGGDIRFMFLSGSAHWPLAVGAFLAANLLVLRSRRHGTAELEDTTVTPSSVRTWALLTASLAAFVLGVVLIAGTFVLFGAGDGVPVRLEDGFVDRAMHPFELLQGPLVVLVMSLVGIVLGRWVPTRAVGPLMLVPAVIGFFHSTWRFSGEAWRFSPLMVHEHQLTWVQETPSSGYSILAGFDVAGLGWHLVYLGGACLLLGAAAVARTERSPRLAAVAVVGGVLAAIGGVLQLG